MKDSWREDFSVCMTRKEKTEDCMWVVLGVENSLIVTTLSVKESEAVRKVVEVVEMVGWGGGGRGER